MLLWKFAKDGVTALTELDRAAVPPHLTLLQRGYRDGIELLWVTRREAERIRRFEQDNEGKNVAEAVRTQ